MSARPDLIAANERFAADFRPNDAHSPRFAVVTCMDARIDPAEALGLNAGDAHVIRNGGGLVTDDALRSLVLSHWLFGTNEVFVVAHTDCGLMKFTNDELHAKLRDEGGVDASAIDFLPFADLDEAVAGSVARIRESPLLEGVEAHGFVYDVATGRLRAVP